MYVYTHTLLSQHCIDTKLYTEKQIWKLLEHMSPFAKGMEKIWTFYFNLNYKLPKHFFLENEYYFKKKKEKKVESPYEQWNILKSQGVYCISSIPLPPSPTPPQSKAGSHGKV